MSAAHAVPTVAAYIVADRVVADLPKLARAGLTTAAHSSKKQL